MTYDDAAYDKRADSGDCPWCGSRMCDRSELRCPGLQDDAERERQHRITKALRWRPLEVGSWAATLPGKGETVAERRRGTVTFGWMEPQWTGREFAFRWVPAHGKKTPDRIAETFREFIGAAPIKGL